MTPHTAVSRHTHIYDVSLLQQGRVTLGTLLIELGWDGRHTNGVRCGSVLYRLRVFRLLTFADLAMIFLMSSCIVCSVYVPFVDLYFYGCCFSVECHKHLLIDI